MADSDFIIENGILKKYVGSAKDVVVPEGVTAIDHVFNPIRFDIPEKIDALPTRPMYIQRPLLPLGSGFLNAKTPERITLPDSMERLGAFTFDRCLNLKVIVISRGVTKIHNLSIGYCPRLAAIRVDPNNPVYSSDASGVLYNKEKTTLLFCPQSIALNAFHVPDSVTGIRSIAFYKNRNLKSITLPKGLTKIETSTFSHAKRLKSIELPADVALIERDAFDGCGRLKTVRYAGSAEDRAKIRIEKGNDALTKAEWIYGK